MARTKTIDILLIRSGPTEWDRQGRLSGNADLPLSTSVEAECEKVLSAVERKPVRVVTGPDEASVKVGKIAANAFGCRSRADKALAEVGLGLWQGMTAAELEQRYTSAFNQWKNDPASIVPSEGEPFLDSEHRLLATVARLAARTKSGECLGLVLRPIARGIVKTKLVGRPITELWKEVEAETAIELIQVSGDKLKAYRPAIVRAFL
jgi:broad specificity phosphatase PhoE